MEVCICDARDTEVCNGSSVTQLIDPDAIRNASSGMHAPPGLFAAPRGNMHLSKARYRHYAYAGQPPCSCEQGPAVTTSDMLGTLDVTFQGQLQAMPSASEYEKLDI
jgi:hypothetical protein